MALASTVMSGAGAASQTLGAYYGAKSEKSALGFQAEIADINARNSELAAQQELRSGQFAEQTARLDTAALKARQRVGLAAGNVDLTEGSALNVLTSTDYIGETDANTIAANAVRSAWGYRTQATDYRNQASVSRANAAGISPLMAGATSLIEGASTVASKWHQGVKSGAITKPNKKNGWQVGDFPATGSTAYG